MLILSIYDEQKRSAIFIEKILREKYGIRIGNNKVQEVLQHMAGISKKGKNRGKKRRWVRYERKHCLYGTQVLSQ